MQRIAGFLLLGVIFIALILGTGCTSSQDSSTIGVTDTNNSEGGKIFISGAFALYPMMIFWTEEYHKLHPEFTFEVSAGGAGKGMTDTLSGMVDIGMISRDIKSEEEAQGAKWVAVTQDAVVGTINADNPYKNQILSRGLTKNELKEIFINNSISTWADLLGVEGKEDVINVYTRSDACGAADVWSAFFKGHQEDLKGTAVFGDPGLAEAVRADKLGIGFNNINYAYDNSTNLAIKGLEIIPLDLNENGKIDVNENFYSDRTMITKAISEGLYPSPPSRYLNLAVKDTFSKNVKTFISWIITDGQQYADANGYIPLSSEKQKESLSVVEANS
jgi:phosphate transport system substrate-binding protein